MAFNYIQGKESPETRVDTQNVQQIPIIRAGLLSASYKKAKYTLRSYHDHA